MNASSGPRGVTRRMRTVFVAAVCGATLVGGSALAQAAPVQAPPPQCNQQAMWQAASQSVPQSLGYLASHPDLANEMWTVHQMPKDQRKAAMHSYAQSHQQEMQGFMQTHSAMRDYMKACHPQHMHHHQM
ncbi:hemophore-related protein [Speluncibacter jeojiensis]|uniref:Heme-binding protein n=1 Tax=Speluncibacter jeojiensis TaxID=2710754 RepID=A0A9X4LYB3_9ACTN|nr:heme-binding protein [Corynebacteriales bacterium D3-21]